jgi:hypothetical protein
MSKEFKDNESGLWTVVKLGIALIYVVFLTYAFFIKPSEPCGIDRQFLYCHFHPMAFSALLGFILFTACCVFFSGIWKTKFGEILMPPNSTWVPIVGFLVGVLGVILMFA